MTHYLIGHLGAGGPGLATALDLDGLLATLPRLDPGQYWVAVDRVAWGLAWVYSPTEWRLDGHGLSAGPGYLIV